jgi:hypothetical protein
MNEMRRNDDAMKTDAGIKKIFFLGCLALFIDSFLRPGF